MNKYYIICDLNGEILAANEYSEFQNTDGLIDYHISQSQIALEVDHDQYIQLKQSTIDDLHYFDGVDFIDISPAPSSYHKFDFVSKQWTIAGRLLDQLKTDKKQEVNSIRSSLSKAPILYQGARYDADAQAISNISSVLLLGGNGTITWRDYDNINHDLSIADLHGLANAIKDRNSVLYTTSWAIKSDIDALVTIQEVDDYVIDFG